MTGNVLRKNTPIWQIKRMVAVIMKSCEELVARESDYFVHLPGKAAREMFFYPLYCGHFIYNKGYHLHRESYDSFLLMYLQSGTMTLELEGTKRKAAAGSFVLIDCYRPHSYSTDTGCEVLWCHFDGPCARAYYDCCISHLDHVFSLTDPYPVRKKLEAIYQIFASGGVIKEPPLSKYLNDILTAFLLYTPIHIGNAGHSETAESTISYINEHFAQNLSIEELADLAGLSQYHFIRTFKKETGFTPHEYLVNIRINTAKYLLKNSRLPVKDICFNTGFSCESVFCSAFKKHMGITPVEYRKQVLLSQD